MNDPEVKQPSNTGAALAAFDTAAKHINDVAAPSKQLEVLFQGTQGLAAMQASLNQMIVEFKRNPTETSQLDAAAYIEALEKAPHLIVSESDPTLFLRRENGDAATAAGRLLKYWAHRRQSFGPDRAFRSLLNGDALDSQAIQCVRSGALAVLPPDTGGRSVLCVDLDRRMAGVGQESVLTSQLNAALFTLSLTFSNPKSQSGGVVILWTLSSKGSLNVPQGEKVFSLIAEALPIKVHSRYIACLAPRGARSLILNQFVPGADRSCGALSFPGVIPHSIGLVGYTPAELCGQMEQNDFRKEDIPVSVGGTWDYQRNTDFLKAQMTSCLEGEQSQSSLAKETSPAPIDDHAQNIELHEPARGSLKGSSAVSPSKGQLGALFRSTQGLAAMQVALNQMIEMFRQNADTTKPDPSAFIEAIERSPHLIVSESDPTLFLRREDGDTEAAARRLLKYWAFRSEHFGPDFAYRSVLNGEALDSDAIRNTRSGALAVLPPDSSGRSVLCFDSTRRIPVVGHEHRALTSRMMSVHYMLSSMSSNPKSQSEGIVMLWVMSQKGSLDRPNAKKFYSLIAEALPIKVHSRYIACCVPRNAKRLFLDKFIPGADRHTGAWLYPGIIPRATNLVGYSPADLCAQMEQVGFEKQNIPASVGGVWDYQNNIAAIDARLASRRLHEQRAHDDDGDKKLAAIESTSVSSNNSMLQLGKPPFAAPGPCLNATMTSSAKTHAESGAGSMEDTLGGKNSSLDVSYSLLSTSDNLPASSGPSEFNATSSETAKSSDAQLQAAVSVKVRLGTFSGIHESGASGSTLFPIGSPFSTNYPASVPDSDEISRLFQSNPVLSNMEIALNQMIGEFKQKPATALPDASAFLEAVERSPHLIAQESHPVTFLRREDGDSVAASRRLLKYWTSRRAILGPNLAYRRLLNGDALDSETTRRLKLGAFANLPPDRDGRSVICIDLERRCRGSPDAEKPYRSKALYYVVSQTFANPKSQSDGVVLLRILSQNGSLDVSNTKKLFDLVAEALPVKLHSLHVACCAPPGAKNFFLDQFIPAMHRMPGAESLPDTITHVGDSPPDLCRQLATCGFQKECLPALTGGTWDYQQFVDFVDEQMLSRTVRLKHMDETTHPKYKVLKNEYGKRKNSNQESGKRKAKIVRIQSAPCELPMVDQNQVRFSEDSLQKLDAAMETIPAECFDQGATEAEKAAYIRKRNAIYSKRKYYKTKLKIESLECSKRSLLAEKEVLKEENLWLEYLLEKAQRCVLAHEEGEQQPCASSVEGSGRDEVTAQVVTSDGLCEHVTANLPSERKRDLTTLSKPPPGVSMSSAGFVHNSPDVSRKQFATMASIPVDGFDPIGSSEEKAEYDRKRNAVYSKRKYYKRKVQVDSLKSSRESLVVENKMLKKENQRLENLYQMAQREALVHEARVQQSPTSAVVGSRLAHSFTSGGAIDPLALAPMPPNQGHIPLVVDSVGMRRLQLAALIAGEEARRLSVHLDSTSLHPSHEGEGVAVDSSRRVSASFSPSSYPNLSHYPQSASEAGLLGATWLPSDRGDFLSGSRVPNVLGLMPTGSEHSVDRMEHRVGQNIFLAAQPMAHQQLGDVSYITELQQLGVLDNLGRAQPPRAGLEQVRHLLNEARIRQDLASQLAQELRSAIPAQAAPSWTVQRTALNSLLLSPLELEQLRQLDRTRISVLLPRLGAQASSQPVSFQRTSQDDLLSELLAIQRLQEHNMRR